MKQKQIDVKSKLNFRNYSLDYLKTILIIMIIVHHLLLRGVDLRSIMNNLFELKYLPFAFINSFLVTAVNIFFLISGYYGIKDNMKKIIITIIEVYIIYWSINIIFILSGLQKFSIEIIKGFIFPISTYWFILVYVILSMIAPYISKGLDCLNLNEHKKLLLILLSIYGGYAFVIDNEILGANRGYSLIFACILYILGNYIRKKTNRSYNYKKSFYIIVFSLACCINGVIIVELILNRMGKFAWMLYSYNNPLIILASVCLFLFFKDLNLQKNIISNLGRYTLYIYIVHSTPVLANIYNSIFINIIIDKQNIFIAFICILFFIILLFLGYIVGRILKYVENIIININFGKRN